MKRLISQSLAISLFVSACATQETKPKRFEAPADTTPVANSQTLQKTPDPVPLQTSPREPGKAVAIPLPDAVIAYTPSLERWAKESDHSLNTISMQAKVDEKLLIRLHGFAPTGSSNGLSIAMADKPLKAVKECLLALGVPSSRILTANYGHQYAQLRHPSRPWVEIYLIKGEEPR